MKTPKLPENDPMRLHPMVRQTLLKAEAAAGRPLDPLECWAWLRDLERVANELLQPGISSVCADLDAPLAVGDVKLYLPSPAAVELCIRAEEMNSPYWRVAVYYILSIGRNAERLRNLIGETDEVIIAEARAWSRGVKCSIESLSVACDWIFGAIRPDRAGADSKPKPTGEANWARIVSVLMAEYHGLPPHSWMYGMNVLQLRRRLEYREQRIEEEEAEMAKASGKVALPNCMGHLAKTQRKYNSLAREFTAWAVDTFKPDGAET